MLRSWCFVFLLKQSGALAEEGAESAGLLCVALGSQDRGCQLSLAWERQSCPPETPMGVMRKCHSLSFPQPPTLPESQEFGGRSRDTSWRVHGVPTQSAASEDGLVSGCGCWGVGTGPLHVSLASFPALCHWFGLVFSHWGLGHRAWAIPGTSSQQAGRLT